MATGDFGKFVSRVKQSAISVAGELTPVLKVREKRFLLGFINLCRRIPNFGNLE